MFLKVFKWLMCWEVCVLVYSILVCMISLHSALGSCWRQPAIQHTDLIPTPLSSTYFEILYVIKSCTRFENQQQTLRKEKKLVTLTHP